MSDDASQPVALAYAARPNPWPRRLATAGVLAGVVFILLIVPLGAFDFRAGLAAGAFLASPFVALALGLAARARSSRDDLDTRGRARWAIVLGTAELAILLGVALVMPQLRRSRETANRVMCQSQLRALGQAVLLYTNDNLGQWPPTLDVLLTASDATAEVFVCPSSSDVPAPPGTALSANPKHSSYIYVGRPPSRGMRSDPPGDAVVLYERLIDHDDGINVLFDDGHVEWLNLNEAKHLVAELQAGRNPPRPFTPATAPSPPVSAR